MWGASWSWKVRLSHSWVSISTRSACILGQLITSFPASLPICEKEMTIVRARWIFWGRQFTRLKQYNNDKNPLEFGSSLYLQTVSFLGKIHCDILMSDTHLIPHEGLPSHPGLTAHVSHHLWLWACTKWLINLSLGRMKPFKSAYWLKLSPVFKIMKPYVMKF